MDTISGRQKLLPVWIVGLMILICCQIEKCESQETGFCDQLVRSKGYSCAEHKIYTEDGFGILLHKVGIIQRSNLASKGNGRSTLDFQAAGSPFVMKTDLENTSSDSSQAVAPADFPESMLNYGSSVDDLLEASQRPHQSVHDNPTPDTRWLRGDSRDAAQNIPINLPSVHEGPSDGPPSDTASSPFLEPISRNSAGLVPPPESDPQPRNVPPNLPPSTEPFSSQTTPFSIAPSEASAQQPGEWTAGSPPPWLSEDPDSTIPIAFSPTAEPWSTSPNTTPDPTVAPAQNQPPGTNNSTNSPRAEPVPENTHNFPDNGKSVLLLHPELLNGDSWFKVADPLGHSSTPLLPFALADAGFDVWIGHERATYWTHDHLRLNSSSDEFWDWSWDEHAKYDVPAMLGYIRDTAHSRVHLVGVSQSAVVATAAATQVGIAMLMKSLVLVCPTVYRGNEGASPLQSWGGSLTRIINEPQFSSNTGQFNFTREFGVSSVSLGGSDSIVSGSDCCISSKITLFDNGWDGSTSFSNVEHVQQAFAFNTFQHFDYGNAGNNMVAYGQDTPPSYAPQNITVSLPILIIYGGHDRIAPPGGVEELVSRLQAKPTQVYLPSYAHFDLFFSSSRYQDVYEPILTFLRSTLSGAPGEPARPAQALTMNETVISTQAAPPAA